MNSKVFSLASSIVVIALLVIGAILGWNAMNTEATLDPVTLQVIGDYSAVSTSVNYTMFLMYASFALVAVFMIWGIIINPRKFVSSAIGVGILLVIFIICYSMASSEATGGLKRLPGATEFWIKWSDVGVLLTFTLFGLAILLLVVQAVRSLVSAVSK